MNVDQKDESCYILELESSFDGSLIAASLSSMSISINDTFLKPVCKLECIHSDRINGIKFFQHHPQILVSTSDDQSIRLWDLRQNFGGPVQDIRAGEAVMDVAVGHDDALLACAVGTRVVFYDIRSSGMTSWATAAVQLGEYADVHNDTINQVRFHPLRKTELTTSSEDGLICTFNTAVCEGEEAVVSIMNTECPVRRFGFFGETSEGLYCLSTVETASFWHPLSAQRIGLFPNIREDFGLDYLVDCFYSGGNLHLLGGNHNGDGQLFSITPTDSTPLAKIKGGHSSTIRSCTQTTGNSPIFITGGEDAKLCAWESSMTPARAPISSKAQKSHHMQSKQIEKAKERKAYHHSPY